MSVDLWMALFVETNDVDALRAPLEQRLATDDDLGFVLVPLAHPSGFWVTLTEPERAPDVIGFGANFATAGLQTHELVSIDGACSLTTFTPGAKERCVEGLDDESVLERLWATLGVDGLSPEEFGEEVEGLPAATVTHGDDWKKATAPLRPAKPKTPKVDGDGAFTLPQLIEVWRQTRAPEASALADQLSVAGKPPYPKSASSAVKEQRWHAMARAERLEDLPALLASLHDGHSTEVAHRVTALDDWPEDPRIGSAYARLFEQPAHLNISTMHLWKLLAERVVRQADPRTKARLDAVAAQGTAWTSLFRPHAREPIARLLESTRKRLEVAIAATKWRALTAAERSRLGRSTPREDAAAALAAISAAPDDLSRRLVYADMLSEADDPRGEFISLQCLDAPTAAQRRRAAALLGKHGDAWLKPLHVAGLALEWEQGFPAVFEVHVTARRQLSPVLGHPAWATIHTIVLGPSGLGATPLEVVLHPAMKHVLRVEGLSASDVRSLSKLGRALPFRSLVIESADDKLLKLLTAERFPALLHVHLDGTGLTRAQVDFMTSRPGVEVTRSERRYTRVPRPHPATLEPLSADALAKLVARVEKGERAVERAAQREKTVPSRRELDKAIASKDHFAAMDLLDRAARLGGDALQTTVDHLFAANPPTAFLAGAMAPVMREVTLAADQWVDLAEGGVWNENNAVRDLAVANARGLSKQRLAALEKTSKRKQYGAERLRPLVKQLAKLV